MKRHYSMVLAVAAALFAGQSLAGTLVNGVPTPGPLLQGTQINGLPTPGPLLQGARIDGLSAGPVVQAIQSSNAPNWSALPAAQLTVRLPN
jgi:hypothetical protein